MTDDSVISTETFTYDAAGNLTDDSNDTTFAYDANNRLTSYNGNSVLYDMDGNMLSNGSLLCTYDSSNKLNTANGHTYTYNAEDVRIRNLCEDEDTTYTYNTNAKLSMLLMKTTNGVVTKYVYGKGLIGEETNNSFKTYHFDCRGSTIAITDASGNITDTFAYDTYGKLLTRTGTSDIIFGYNGRDGVVTDSNGLIYMRARYYSPEMRRFVNADIVAGELSNAITLNRFAYANGNPVSNIDPFGLSSTRDAKLTKDEKVNHDLSQQIARQNARNRKLAADEKNFHTTNYNLAIYVVVTSKEDGGLPVVGHTQLYFLGDDESYYFTEYSGPKKTIFDKNLATVNTYRDMYFELDSIDNNENIHYVVLEGDFNASVEYAKKMAEDSLGGYDFLYNNCCDYTNEVLSKAEIDSKSVQKYIKKETNNTENISIPITNIKSIKRRIERERRANNVKRFFNNVWDKVTFWN